MTSPLGDVLRSLSTVLAELADAADGGVLTPAPDEALNLAEVADLLDVSTELASQWVRAGEIPGRKIRGQWRFSRDAVLRSLTEGGGE